MDLGGPAKRARRTQAAKREAELARVEDKWADLDITKFRCTTDCENRKTFATLQPAAGDWTVSQWRNPNAYVQDSEWVEEDVFKERHDHLHHPPVLPMLLQIGRDPNHLVQGGGD